MSSLIITLQIKSYHPFYINRFVSAAKKQLSPQNYWHEKQIFLPQKITRYTVLRSPHVDKKSREQFERRTSIRLMQWIFPIIQGENQFPLYFFVQSISNLAVGVQLKLTYVIKN